VYRDSPHIHVSSLRSHDGVHRPKALRLGRMSWRGTASTSLRFSAGKSDVSAKLRRTKQISQQCGTFMVSMEPAGQVVVRGI
jgi:hypothetical protein